ncbi:hypothetical protein R3Q06_35570 [Rhodococcus erythropolis]|uniref:hypothetical protein n=1 Tax=Rhodococcus erythropolis TaxID=1833 RepID=UPI0029498103|nr:hypothetical protein [Rhodococcus erythropolis]MDV6278692.1 hypothetical protein [Rhodococcus erythropolis]
MPAEDTTMNIVPPFEHTPAGHLSRTRKLVYAALSAVLATVAVSAAAGVSTAAPEYSTETMWYTRNYAEHPLWGELYKEVRGDFSNITIPKSAPLPPLDQAGADQPTLGDIFNHEYTWGRICYLGSWWNLPRKTYATWGGTYFDLVPYGPEREKLLIRINGSADVILIQTTGDSDCRVDATRVG